MGPAYGKAVLMDLRLRCKGALFLFMAFILMLYISACSEEGKSEQKQQNNDKDTSMYVAAIEDEPDTVDFQCTTIYYTIATNVFDRLVETEADESGDIKIVPSLAESWEVSPDRRTYTFSNGSPLTAADVQYTLMRLLTYPESCNQSVAEIIEGAQELEEGKAEDLTGFNMDSDYDFSITLSEPFEAFLASLSVPQASILDAETTSGLDGIFGKDAASTIGTGPYILTGWEPGKGMTLKANKKCWSGAPNNEGLNLYFMEDPEDEISLYENGGLDVLDLDEVGNSAEFFIHGDIYQDKLYSVNRLGIEYIALNESKKPLDNMKVRKALQLALNRETLLDAVYSGRGAVENGIFPHGLYGFDPDLPEIPYDPERAKSLLTEAGLADGFDLTVSVKSSSTMWESTLMKLAAEMWEEIGVKVEIEMLEESEFMSRRKAGDLMCYTALWTADYNDPENFINTFYGSTRNTTYRSLCYPRENIMKRVRDALKITDPKTRIEEYHMLQKIIVQDDAAWIPLFSREWLYITSDRVDGIYASWNGSVKNNYRKISIKKE